MSTWRCSNGRVALAVDRSPKTQSIRCWCCPPLPAHYGNMCRMVLQRACCRQHFTSFSSLGTLYQCNLGEGLDHSSPHCRNAWNKDCLLQMGSSGPRSVLATFLVLLPGMLVTVNFAYPRRVQKVSVSRDKSKDRTDGNTTTYPFVDAAFYSV